MNNLKNAILSLFILVAVLALAPINVKAQEPVIDPIIVSNNTLSISPNTETTFAAALTDGTDATNLICAVADSKVVSVVPVAYAGNVAAFQVNQMSYGSTIIAIYNKNNPTWVKYIPVTSNPIQVSYCDRLGTDLANYCTVQNYKFSLLDATNRENNKYNYLLTINCKCVSYVNPTPQKWSCMGTFYDASGKAISKVNIYSDALSKDKFFAGYIKVPTNAVSLVLEGF